MLDRELGVDVDDSDQGVDDGFAEGVIRAGCFTDKTSVGNYEKHTTVPAAYIAGVCDAYDINPSYILWGEPPKERRAPASAERALEIIRHVSKATGEESLDQLLKIIQAMEAADESPDP